MIGRCFDEDIGQVDDEKEGNNNLIIAGGRWRSLEDRHQKGPGIWNLELANDRTRRDFSNYCFSSLFKNKLNYILIFQIKTYLKIVQKISLIIISCILI